MSRARAGREKKRQLGQFMTPAQTARRLVGDLPLTRDTTVLEPSFGDGAFILALVERFMDCYEGSIAQRFQRILERNIFGVELDEDMYDRCIRNLEVRWGRVPTGHNLVRGDFFRQTLRSGRLAADTCSGELTDRRLFDFVVGNPPFGGTIDPEIQDELDSQFGFRNGEKIKKETYSFFIVKCVDSLSRDGLLRFVCSDTFLTIPTMRGLRRFLMDQGAVNIQRLSGFSEETTQPMVVLDFTRGGESQNVTVDGRMIPRTAIEQTGNLSWQVGEGVAAYFAGPKLGDFFVASSGMTIGRNSLFVRAIEDGWVKEPYELEYFEDPITLDKEFQRARLGHLSVGKQREIRELEAKGATRRNVRAIPLSPVRLVQLPHPDYLPYNKSSSAIIYTPPEYVVFWREEGDAILTFKRNGNWYLHGVGGRPYFKREGLTWQLIAQRLNCRYLPPGSILDSGAPCAFLRGGVPRDEMYFVLGWTLSPLCDRLLKGVLNHTRNIQSKDFERLPYPFWVGAREKAGVVACVRRMVEEGIDGRVFNRSDDDVREVGALFDVPPETVLTNLSGEASELPISIVTPVAPRERERALGR